MPTFAENIAAIRQAVLGRQVRAAIADSLEQTYEQYLNVQEFADQMGVIKYVHVHLKDNNGYLWGDVNGDGVASNADLTLVSRYVDQGQSIDPRGDGTTRWKDCVNFDTSTSDIVVADRLTLATLLVQKQDINDYIARYTIVYADDSETTIWGIMPNLGAGAQRAPQWFNGDKMSGEYTGSRIFNTSGIELAVVGDMYVHTSDLSRGYIYRCVVGGPANAAQWVYAGRLFE